MNNAVRGFAEKIAKKKINIAVVGLGYVGLPLAIEFAKKGFEVTGIEIDKGRLGCIKRKESYISDVQASQLRRLLSSKKFSATADFGALQGADVIIICVPTPLKRKYQPDISYIVEAVKGIAKNLKKVSLVILESTTYPGTTEDVILPLLESHNLKHGRDFYLSFSPERIDPGNKDCPVNKIPKIVGGISPQATRLAALVYKNIVARVVPVSTARAAEATKLLENTFRLINIGLIDEMAMICHKMDIDIWEVVDAAKTKPFGFMPFYPGPGVGGHCIPKDPLYLYWKARHFGFRSRFIKLASDVINYMPEYVVDRVIDLLRQNAQYVRHKTLADARRSNVADAIRNTKILVIGVTYKKDIKDLRKSPPLDIIDILHKKGIAAAYYDPLIPYLKFNQINLKSVDLKKKGLLGKFSCVIIATDHSDIDYGFILKNSRLIFDTRNVYKDIDAGKVVKL